MPQHKCSTCGQAAEDGAEFRYKSDGETPLKTCMRCLEKKSKAAASAADPSAFNEDYPRELLTVQHRIEDHEQRIGKLEGVAFDLDEGALPPAATMDTRGADFAEWFPKRDESEPIESRAEGEGEISALLVWTRSAPPSSKSST